MDAGARRTGAQLVLWTSRGADTIGAVVAVLRHAATPDPLGPSGWGSVSVQTAGPSKCPYYDTRETLVTKVDVEKGYPFELNGEKLFASNEKEKAGTLLEIGYEAKVIQRKPEDYRLFSVKEGKSYKPEDDVNLDVDNQFIAEPIAPTPVAGR